MLSMDIIAEAAVSPEPPAPMQGAPMQEVGMIREGHVVHTDIYYSNVYKWDGSTSRACQRGLAVANLASSVVCVSWVGGRQPRFNYNMC
jgi:hypothetical protein